MHIQIRDDNGELLGDLYISREIQKAQILQAELDILDELVQIARAQNVPVVTIMVPLGAIKEMESLGWSLSKESYVMFKER
jgi:hypothetical protein